MNKQEIIKAIQELKSNSPQRNFNQSVDFIVNLQHLNIKRADEKVDLFFNMPHSTGKVVKICLFADAQLETKAKNVVDKIILKSDFINWNKKKKEIKKLAKEYDFFIAQADLMADLAKIFGRVLGAAGKMPNPKAGCVVPGAIPSLEPLKIKLQTLVRIHTKTDLSVKVKVGSLESKEEDVADNVVAIYNHLEKNLPVGKNNVRNSMIKFTMSPTYIFGVGLVKKKAEVKNE